MVRLDVQRFNHRCLINTFERSDCHALKSPAEEYENKLFTFFLSLEKLRRNNYGRILFLPLWDSSSFLNAFTGCSEKYADFWQRKTFWNTVPEQLSQWFWIRIFLRCDATSEIELISVENCLFQKYKTSIFYKNVKKFLIKPLSFSSANFLVCNKLSKFRISNKMPIVEIPRPIATLTI